MTQRWRRHVDSYRPEGEPIDPRRFGVEVIPERDARPFVIGHHYSGSFPAARLSVGLFRSRGHEAAELVGVAVFSVGVVHAAQARRWTGLPPQHVAELGRFVLLDDVEANGETWFLARAFEAARRSLPGLHAVIAYSDPVPRTDLEGRTTLPGHIGGIYLAHNGTYHGRSEARVLHLAPDGTALNGRMLTKIRRGEQGEAYATRRLIELGAPPPRDSEDGAEWVARALAEGPFRRLRHPGNHVYTWPIGDHPNQRRGLAALMPQPAAGIVRPTAPDRHVIPTGLTLSR